MIEIFSITARRPFSDKKAYTAYTFTSSDDKNGRDDDDRNSVLCECRMLTSFFYFQSVIMCCTCYIISGSFETIKYFRILYMCSDDKPVLPLLIPLQIALPFRAVFCSSIRVFFFMFENKKKNK